HVDQAGFNFHELRNGVSPSSFLQITLNLLPLLINPAEGTKVVRREPVKNRENQVELIGNRAPLLQNFKLVGDNPVNKVCLGIGEGNNIIGCQHNPNGGRLRSGHRVGRDVDVENQQGYPRIRVDFNPGFFVGVNSIVQQFLGHFVFFDQ